MAVRAQGSGPVGRLGAARPLRGRPPVLGQPRRHRRNTVPDRESYRRPRRQADLGSGLDPRGLAAPGTSARARTRRRIAAAPGLLRGPGRRLAPRVSPHRRRRHRQDSGEGCAARSAARHDGCPDLQSAGTTASTSLLTYSII